MLDYWKRLTALPDHSLAKKALLENVQLRTNWILTIEKLVKTFNLIETPDDKFSVQTKYNINEHFRNTWKNRLMNEDAPRLQVYRNINSEFSAAKHLELPFPLRKIISKIRCSNHCLEIEKGRHNNKPREKRICLIYKNGSIENETHFLLNCTSYKPLKDLFGIHFESIFDFLETEN